MNDQCYCGGTLGEVYRSNTKALSAPEPFLHPPILLCARCDFTPNGGPPVHESRVRNLR